MECGRAILVKDVWGEIPVRYVAQCGGQFIVISRAGDRMNGLLLHDWRAVLRDLISQLVPAGLTDKMRTAQSNGADGKFYSVMLVYPLAVSHLAAVLGADAGEVRAELADLAVRVE